MIVQEFCEIMFGDPHDAPKPVRREITCLY
jgi:hypothetical protein